jgi:hypothetical protein
MSLFDYPRINIKGTIQLSPGTANNDDYAAAVSLPQSWGPFAGETLALIDSKKVEARTYGMSDEAFIAWAQKAQSFDVKGTPGQQQQIIPAEWNYYGPMESKVVEAKVIGVQTGPQEIYSEPDADIQLTSLIGASLSYSGHITDVNSEGSPPATQFFIDSLTLTNGGQTFLSGTASKGACQWLNFYRNVSLTADGGAGGYVYHVIKKQPGTTIDIPGFDDSQIVGVVFRYYLYRPIVGTRGNAAIEELYKKGETNPATLEIVGTFAPLLGAVRLRHSVLEPGDHRARNRSGVSARSGAFCGFVPPDHPLAVPLNSPAGAWKRRVDLHEFQARPADRGRYQPAGEFSVHVQHQ